MSTLHSDKVWKVLDPQNMDLIFSPEEWHKLQNYQPCEADLVYDTIDNKGISFLMLDSSEYRQQVGILEYFIVFSTSPVRVEFSKRHGPIMTEEFTVLRFESKQEAMLFKLRHG